MITMKVNWKEIWNTVAGKNAWIIYGMILFASLIWTGLAHNWTIGLGGNYLQGIPLYGYILGCIPLGILCLTTITYGIGYGVYNSFLWLFTKIIIIRKKPFNPVKCEHYEDCEKYFCDG